MNENKIGVRYAKALFELAKEQKLSDIILKDVELINAIIAGLDDFKILLHSPVVKTSEKKKIFSEAFGSKIHALSLSFLNIVLANKRESYLEHICRNFIKLTQKEMGITSAKIMSASPISNDSLSKIHNTLEEFTKSKVEIKNTVNEDLIGGFVLQLDDKQYDASIASKLQNMKKELTNSSFDLKI